MDIEIDALVRTQLEQLIHLATDLCAVSSACLWLSDTSLTQSLYIAGLSAQEATGLEALQRHVMTEVSPLCYHETQHAERLFHLSLNTRPARFYLGLPLRSPDGKAMGVLSVMHNTAYLPSDWHLSGLQRLVHQIEYCLVQWALQQHLMAEVKAQRNRTATIAHELRTPLTATSAALTLLGSGVLGEVPSALKELLSAAQHNNLRMASLINGLIDYEALQADSLTVDWQPTDLQQLLQVIQVTPQSAQ